MLERAPLHAVTSREGQAGSGAELAVHTLSPELLQLLRRMLHWRRTGRGSTNVFSAQARGGEKLGQKPHYGRSALQLPEEAANSPRLTGRPQACAVLPTRSNCIIAQTRRPRPCCKALTQCCRGSISVTSVCLHARPSGVCAANGGHMPALTAAVYLAEL